MKLITKDCPNCGAKLSFEEYQTETFCEYCKQKIKIGKNREPQNYHTHFQNDNEEYELSIVTTPNSKVVKYSRSIKYQPKTTFLEKALGVVVIAFLVFLLGLYFVDKNIKSRKNENNSPMRYVETFDDIDKKTLEVFHKETVKKLNSLKNRFPEGSKSTEWEYVGMYLLVSNTRKDSKLYQVYTKEIKTKEKVYKIYNYASYLDLEISDDNIVLTKFQPVISSSTCYLDSKKEYYAYGYENLEELYYKAILSNSSDYTILRTEGI